MRIKKFWAIILVIVCVQFSLSTYSARNAYAVAAGVSGTLSIIPGLGQAINGEPLEGLVWLTTIVGLYFSKNYYLSQAGWDLWFYNMYDAYRDAKPNNHNFTNYNVFQNYIAAYNPLNLIDPIGAPVVAFGGLVGAKRGYPALGNPAKILMYGFVGLGEEGLFRGFLFPAMTDVFFDSKLMGAITSSILFALIHVTGGKSNLAPVVMAQRFTFGMLFSWQAHRNKYDLREGIFAHAWYDILVDPSAGTYVRMNIPIP